MKRFLKTTLSLALAFIMLAGSIPLSSFDFSGLTIEAEAAALTTQSQFDAKLDEFIKETKYKDKSTYENNDSSILGIQCFGFANYIARYFWGSFPTGRSSGKSVNNGWKVTYGSSALDNLCVGDIIRFKVKGYNVDHSVFVTSIKGGNIYFCQANSPGGNIVTYNKSKSRSEFEDLLSVKLADGSGKTGWVAHYKSSVLGTKKLSINNQTPTFTNITAHISAKITAEVQTYGYYLSKNKSDVDQLLKSVKETVSITSTTNAISADIKNLTPNTTYYYRFYVSFNGKYEYSPTASFKTGNTAPSAAKIKTSTPNIGINDTATFTWNEAKDTDSYIVKIYKNNVLQSTSGEIKGFQYVTNKITSAGNYEAEIISKNSAKQVVGNRVSFTVHPNLTVTFKDPISGKVIKTENNVAYGHSATPPKAPEHEGYTFANKWDSDYTKITSDKTITAVYNTNTYTVKFVNSVTNAIIKTEKVAFNKSATAPETVTAPADGYTFKGWDKTFDVIKGDTTVYTVFEWYDSAYPTVVTLNSISRNSTKAGYDISVKVTASSTATTVVSGRIVAALKSSQGALLNSTESSAFALNPGDSNPHNP